MGSSQSNQLPSEDERHEHPTRQQRDDDDDDEDDDIRHDLPTDTRTGRIRVDDEALVKKILQQEPEMLPFHASASPLSPQLSTHSTPRVAPSIKVWDPYNVLAPRPPPHSHFHLLTTEVYLINHGECHMSLRPDLVAGRCPDAALTPNGKRQARALAVFLKSQGVRFNAVYTSPLDRVRATALSVCQELNFAEEQIQPSDALVEMSQGHWEGCQRSEIFTPETVSLMERTQPDFSAPSGESLRQVEFRMIQFLNGRIMTFPDDKFRPDFSQQDHNIDNQDPSHWEMLQHRYRQVGFPRKKSGKSRLQIVSSSGDHEADDEMSPREPTINQGGFVSDINNARSTSTSMSTRFSCVGIFSHSIPIKCLLMGVLGCSVVMMDKICIDDSSVTVLRHSWKQGWQIKRLNDTSHLRLL